MQQRAAGLLLWAQQAGDSDRLLHWRSAAVALQHGTRQQSQQCHIDS